MDLTRRLRGHTVKDVLTNGHLLLLKLEDGSEVTIRWVNHNGETLKGKPVIDGAGFRLVARGVQDLIIARQAGI